jgi:hypothetical protein
MRTVFCVKLGSCGLDAPPSGPLGERIYNEVSAEAWEMGREDEDDPNEYRLPFRRSAVLVAKHMEDSSSATRRRPRRIVPEKT